MVGPERAAVLRLAASVAPANDVTTKPVPASSIQVRVASATGGVASAGTAPLGSLLGQGLNAPVVSIAARPDGKGYWLVGADGGIFTSGDAGFYGSMGGKSLNARAVAIAAAPNGRD